MLFVSFSCLIPLARSPSTTLNESGGSILLCLVSGLKKKITQSFPITYDVSCRFFIEVLCQAEEVFFYSEFAC